MSLIDQYYAYHLNRNSTRVITRCINSSRSTWFITHTKRSDTCSRFLEITYQTYLISAKRTKSHRRQSRPGPGLIILLFFARAIYDEFDANAMVTDRIITTHSFRKLWLCFTIIVILAIWKSTHTSHSACTSGLNTNYQQWRNGGFGVTPAASKGNCNSHDAVAAYSWRQIWRHDKLSMIFTIIGVQKSVSVQRLLGLDGLT